MGKTIFILISCLITGGCLASENPQFKKVFEVISSPKVFNLSFPTMLQSLIGICKEREAGKQYGPNVECIPQSDVQSFTVLGTESQKIGFIKVQFIGTDKCPYIKDSLKKAFGKPTEIIDECTISWHLKPLQKGSSYRYVRIERAKSKDVIYFAIGEEQGP